MIVYASTDAVVHTTVPQDLKHRIQLENKPMALVLSFPSADPLNNVFVDSANGAPVYQTQSHNTARRVTNLARFIPHAGTFQVIAEIHWENMTLNPASVLYRGQKMFVTDYLRKTGHFFNTFGNVFVAPDGREYKWKVNASFHSSVKLKLHDDSDNLIAESHVKEHGYINRTYEGGLDIQQSGFPILDDIVLGFIILNHLERHKRNMEDTAAILNS